LVVNFDDAWWVWSMTTGHGCIVLHPQVS